MIHHHGIALMVATVLVAQEPPRPVPSEFFHGRRVALMEQIRSEAKSGESHVVVLRGASTGPDMAAFYQDHDFYYLSGVREPDAAVLLFPAEHQEELLVPPYSPFTAKWDGSRLAPGEGAEATTGFAKVGNSRSLSRRLQEYVDEHESVVVWTSLQPQPNKTATSFSAQKAAASVQRDKFDKRPTREQAFVERLNETFQSVEVRDVGPLVGRLRATKQPAEVAQIRAASQIAAHGLAEAMKSTVPGIYEFQIAAAARYVFSRMGAGPDAYAAIVGAGPNGCVLHYNANSRQVVDGDLIVMDYGPTVHGYCTDVTRTFPANGVFSASQRELVANVYGIQQQLIAAVRPGVKLSALDALCGQLLRAKGYRVDHGPCHHVGLAVHDKEGDVLEPGMVITVEPGAYLHDEGMGCRIEDVVLVTEDGHEVLSAGVPSTPDAIEALMREAGVHQSPVGSKRE